MDIDELFEFEECDNGYILSSFRSENDPSVTELEIPSKYKGKPITSIGEYAFFRSEHLCRVKIPDGITKIDNKAFAYCEKLKTVILPDSLKDIGDNAFCGCVKLENITFPDGLEIIEECAFFSCENLKSVILPNRLKKIRKCAFYGCSELIFVVFPNNLTEISTSLFESCYSLDKVELPDSIKEIGDFAFSECCLTSVKFPTQLENIGEGAFYGCDLCSVTFPSTLEKIGNEAFSYCNKLEKADFGGGTPLLGTGVFSFCPKLGAENIMQSLACSADISKPFQLHEYFDWDSALREDVFTLAMKYDSFALFDKGKVLKEIIGRDLNLLLPLTEKAGWNITEECMEELLDFALKNGFVEITAWLLDYKNRKIGFGDNNNRL